MNLNFFSDNWDKIIGTALTIPKTASSVKSLHKPLQDFLTAQDRKKKLKNILEKYSCLINSYGLSQDFNNLGTALLEAAKTNDACKWQEANRKTEKIWLAVGNDRLKHYLNKNEVEKALIDFSFIDTLDQLWLTATKGHFGYTSQIEVLKDTESQEKDKLFNQNKLLEAIGRKNGLDITYSIKALKGHLPTIPIGVCFIPNILLLRISFTQEGWFWDNPFFLKILKELEPKLSSISRQI